MSELYEKATPRPWSLSYGFNLDRKDDSRAVYVAPAHPEQIGIRLATPWIEGAWDTDAEADANARLIVHAVNNIERLEAQIVSLREDLEGYLSDCTNEECERCIKARSTLSSTGEG